MVDVMSVVVQFPRAEVIELGDPACTNGNPEWWFEEAQFARGKRLCAKCSHRTRCLDEALASGERLGVWGGLTPAERDALPDAVVLPLRRHRPR